MNSINLIIDIRACSIKKVKNSKSLIIDIKVYVIKRDKFCKAIDFPLYFLVTLIKL